MTPSTRLGRAGLISVATGALLALAACAPAAPPPAPEPTTAPSETTAPDTGSGVLEEFRALLPQEIIDSGVITVGSPMSSPPLIYVDNGKPTGMAFDISQEIAALLGVEAVWEDLAFPGVIPGLQAGNIDISMGVIGDTPARQEVLDFVDLFVNESALMTQKGNPQNISDLPSACGLTLGTQTGSLQLVRMQAASEQCVADGKGPITINEYTSQADGQAAVQSERIVAYYAPFITMNHVARTAGDGTIFEMGTGRYPDNPFGIAMQKDRGTFAQAIQGALLELVKNGRYLEIMTAYGSEDGAITEDQVLINGAGTDAFPLD